MTSSEFQKKLYNWHQTIEKRDMPWVGEKDPYKIWLSEIILQQTRVEQGRDYYIRFIEHFPTVIDLANAPEDNVLRLWQGLGYYSRARNLQYSAKYIVENHKGIFPTHYDQIIKLKGVGEYTASAIASFAYNLPYPVVDGNVYRILSRICGIEGSISDISIQKKIKSIANEWLDKKNPAKYNQAIMDFGAQGCIPSTPTCPSCLFAKNCSALIQNKVSSIPLKKTTIVKKNRFFVFKIIIENNTIAIEKRENNDIWKGLYQLPMEEVIEENFHRLALSYSSKKYAQVLTHQKINAIFIKSEIIPNKGLYIDFKSLNKFGFPKIISTFIDENYK